MTFNYSIPVDSDIKIQIRQTEEIIQQLKRIADALEAGNHLFKSTAVDPFLPSKQNEDAEEDTHS